MGAFEAKGHNFLNVETKLTGQAFFGKYNIQFLDDAIKRGDTFRFVSDLTETKTLFVKGKNGKDGLTTFGKDVNYLKSKGL